MRAGFFNSFRPPVVVPPPADAVRVQVKHLYSGGSGQALTFTNPVAAGNLIVACPSGANHATVVNSIVDSLGNGTAGFYSLIAQQIAADLAFPLNAAWQGIFAAIVTTGGVCTVTWTTDAVTDCGMTIIEYSAAGGFGLAAGAGTTDPAITVPLVLPAKGLVVFATANEQADPGSSLTANLTLVQRDATHLDMQAENLGAPAGAAAFGYAAATDLRNANVAARFTLL